MRRTEAGRRCEDDKIASTVDGFLVGVEAPEHGVRRDFQLILVLTLEFVIGAFDFVFEGIGKGDHLDAGAHVHGLTGRSCATSTAAYQGDLDLIGSRGMYVGDRCGEDTGARAGNKSPTIHRKRSLFLSVCHTGLSVFFRARPNGHWKVYNRRMA